MVPTFGLKIYRTGKFRLGQHHVMLNMHYQIKYPKYKNKCFFIFVEMERLRTVWTFLSPACKRVYSYKFWACSQRKQCTSIFILKNHFMYVAFFIWSFFEKSLFFLFLKCPQAPELIKDDKMARLWFKQDETFLQPKACLSFAISR